MAQNTKTDGNLRAAFAGETQAKRRYLFFAEKADQEGQPQIARLFRAASAAENVHARRHFEAMGAAGSTMDSMTAAVTNEAGGEAVSTKDNLTAAITGEHYEFTKMYPVFIKEAEKDDNVKAAVSFGRANSVEKVHHSLFEAALKALEAKQPLKTEDYYVCGVCGYTVAGEAPEKCPICGALRVRFNKVD